MPSKASFSASTANAKVTGEVVDSMLAQPGEPPTGLRAIGPRITPNFIGDSWSSENTYQYYDVVLVDGTSYIAKKPVPAGIEITDTEYWIEWAEPNAQYADLKDTVESFDTRLNRAVQYVDTAANIATAGLDDGVVVITTGFNEVGDGGAATYIITTGTANGYDMVNAGNGLIAQLQYEPVMNYYQFGARLENGDDSGAITRCHECALDYGFDIEQNGGEVNLNFTVDVKTNLKLNCDLYITTDTPNQVYNIVADENISDITTSAVFTSDDTEVPSELSQYFGYSFRVSNTSENWTLGTRSGSTTTWYHRQLLASDNMGTLLTSPVMVDTSGTSTLSNIQSVSERPITIEGGTYHSSYTDSNNLPSVFYCTRNNTVIKNMALTIEEFGSYVSNDNVAGFINIRECMNNTVENISGMNNSTTSSGSISSYVINEMITYNTLVSNCIFTQGWGAHSSHWSDNSKYIHCVANRIDNHYGVNGPMYIQNCTFIGLGSIYLGYGNGTVYIEGCEFKTTSDATNVCFVRNRTDFPETYSGTAYITNCHGSSDYAAYVSITPNVNSNSNFPSGQGTYIIDNSYIDTTARKNILLISTNSSGSASAPNLYVTNLNDTTVRLQFNPNTTAMTVSNCKISELYLTTSTTVDGITSTVLRVIDSFITTLTANIVNELEPTARFINCSTGGNTSNTVQLVDGYYVGCVFLNAGTTVESVASNMAYLYLCSVASQGTITISGSKELQSCYGLS